MECPAVWTEGNKKRNRAGDEDGKREGAGGGGCGMGSYPVYVVKALKREDVMAGIEFANQYGLRLVVKNTGHDFLVFFSLLFPVFLFLSCNG